MTHFPTQLGQAMTGQAMTEYLIGLTTAVLVLFVPLFDGRSVAGALANALRDAYATFTFLVSLT
jgi:hypothetical protein